MIDGAYSVADFLANRGSLDGQSGGFAISDTAANISANFDTLSTDAHITSIILTDGETLRLTIDEALNDGTALSKITNPKYLIDVGDTAANIEALTTTQIASLSSSLHVGEVEASDTNIALTTTQAAAFESANIVLSAPSGSTVSISDTASNLQGLTTAQIAALNGAGITRVVSTSGTVKFTVGQVVALENAGVTASAPSASVTLYDTSFATLTAVEIAGLPGLGVTNATVDSSSGALTVAQALAFEAIGMKVGIVVGDNITITDTAANIQGMTTAGIAGLPAVGVIGISATGASVTLSVAQAVALETAAVTLTVPTGDVAVIADTAADIESFTSAQIADLSTLHVTQLQATDATATLNVAQTLASETAKVTPSAPAGDSVLVVDTAANIEALTTTQIASLSSSWRVGKVSSSDTNIAVTAAQVVAFESANIELGAPSGSTVSVSDTASNLQFMTTAQIAALKGAGITQLVSTGAVNFTLAQVVALETVGVPASAPGASVVLSDTAANLATLTTSEIAGLPGIGISSVTTSNPSIALTVAQALGFEGINVKVSASGGAGKVSITDTAANIEGMTTAEIASLPAIGVSGINATGASVSLSVAQALALETAAVSLAVPSGDVVVIADAAAEIGTLAPAQITSLSTLHVTQLQATDATVMFNVAQALALETAKVTLAMPAGDSAQVVDTATNLATLTANQIASLSSSLHVGEVEASDTNAAFTKAQAVAFENANIVLLAPSGSTVSISDTASNLRG